MPDDKLDISSMVTWEDGLPVPQWEMLKVWVESGDGGDAEAYTSRWTEVVRRWLDELAPALGKEYIVKESDNFVLLTLCTPGVADELLLLAERCRWALLSRLCGVADFWAPGKQVVLALRNADDYYRYVSLGRPDGKYPGSAGMHIRNGYPHVVLYGPNAGMAAPVVAHELTHVGLYHLDMPLWLEEGLAQMFEHDMTGCATLAVDWELAQKHKNYWGKHGLDSFWNGKGFHRPSKVRTLSYELAEILVRLMVEESRPRWFGLVREPRNRLLAFLRQARFADCGAKASRRILQCELGDLAGRFLGPGDWNPSP